MIVRRGRDDVTFNVETKMPDVLDWDELTAAVEAGDVFQWPVIDDKNPVSKTTKIIVEVRRTYFMSCDVLTETARVAVVSTD